jgi:hypothetical protein
MIKITCFHFFFVRIENTAISGDAKFEQTLENMIKMHNFQKTIFSIAILLFSVKVMAETPTWYSNAINTSMAQLTLAAKQYEPGLNPRSINADGSIRYADPYDWTCGFFPGSLWYLFELSGDNSFKQQAQRFTEALDTVQYFTDTHDLGFMLFCSYGNGYRLTQNKNYKKVLIKGAESLASRFHPTVGCIRSWDFGEWEFPVIIDNMMNLELIYWVAEHTNNSNYINLCTSHADVTIENHFRSDFSSYHVVSYDTLTGKAVQHETFQGYADCSSWSRGQAWGLYGYTYMYSKTKDAKYLKQAQGIANYIMQHPHLPEDKIPLWDFYTRRKGNAPRDASAGALIASALLELSTLVQDGNEYFKFAEEVLQNLSSDNYLAKKGENDYFILKHSTGSFPHYMEINTAINYADYYFLEALVRYGKLMKE